LLAFRTAVLALTLIRIVQDMRRLPPNRLPSRATLCEGGCESEQLHFPPEHGHPQLELFPLPPERRSAISSRRCAVNEQKEKPLARRRFQRGHLFLKQNRREALWVGRFKEDVLMNGRVLRIKRAEVLGSKKDYPTRRLALRALAERLSTINSTTYRPRAGATFDQFATRWIASVLGQFKPSTAENYGIHVRKHLTPFFGSYQMKDIEPEMVQRFVASLKVSPKTVRNICVTLQSMWRSARAWGYVTRDIFDSIVLPVRRRTQRYFFTIEEIQRIISAAKEPHRMFYGLLAETGLRVGELCGLKVDDIDLERGLLIVQQSAWRGKLGDPKNSDSVRVINLSVDCVEQLRTFLKSWCPNQNRLLFATRNGTPWDANMQRKRRFRSLLKALNIQVPKGNGFHAFRHANAALMDRLRVPMKIRQQRLGHSDASITLDIYTHVVGEDSRAAAKQLGQVVWAGFRPLNGL
jgi:integrase